MKKAYICPAIVMSVATMNASFLEASPFVNNEQGNGTQLSKGNSMWDNMQTEDEEK